MARLVRTYASIYPKRRLPRFKEACSTHAALRAMTISRATSSFFLAENISFITVLWEKSGQNQENGRGHGSDFRACPKCVTFAYGHGMSRNKLWKYITLNIFGKYAFLNSLKLFQIPDVKHADTFKYVTKMRNGTGPRIQKNSHYTSNHVNVVAGLRILLIEGHTIYTLTAKKAIE